MATFLTFKTQIANHLRRSDLTTEIDTAVKEAIAHYDSWRWWFLEFSNDTSVTTVANQSSYDRTTDLLPDAKDFDFIKITISGNEYPLNARSQEYIQEMIWSTTSGTGVPEDWSFYDEKLWLYPVPNSAYQLHLYGWKSLTALNDDGDTNAWIEEGKGHNVIRERAKADLRINVIEQPSAIQQAVALAGSNYGVLSVTERAALNALVAQNEKRVTSGLIDAYPYKARYTGAR